MITYLKKPVIMRDWSQNFKKPFTQLYCSHSFLNFHRAMGNPPPFYSSPTEEDVCHITVPTNASAITAQFSVDSFDKGGAAVKCHGWFTTSQH